MQKVMLSSEFNERLAKGQRGFENIQLQDYSGFGAAIVEGSKIVDTRLSWHNFIDAKIGGLELVNCTEFMVIRNISDLTPAIIASGLSGLQPVIDQLDFDMREKMKAIFNAFAQQHNLELPDISNKAQRNAYGELQDSHAKGYQLFDAPISTAIGIYGEKNLYQARNIYETNQNKTATQRDRRFP